jgi:hypothetical protein
MWRCYNPLDNVVLLCLYVCYIEILPECICVLIHSPPPVIITNQQSPGGGWADAVVSSSGSSSSHEAVRARLEAFTTLNDGFDIAERDLFIRGPGDSLGLKQSGNTRFK